MKFPLKQLSFALASLAATWVTPSFAADNAVITWNKAILEAIRTTRPGPTIVSRALNVTSTCAYDAWAAYDAKALATNTPAALRRPSNERTDANKNEAVNYAIYRAAVDLFPTQKSVFDALLTAQGFNPGNATVDTSTPAGVGNTRCAAVLNFRHADGSNQLGDLHPGAYSDYTGYQPVNSSTSIVDPNHWQPLAVPNGLGGFTIQSFLSPHWGKVKPFALKSLDQYKIKEPAKAGTHEYEEQVKQIVAYSANLTDEQKVIAEYWADGPKSELPPGHWNLFAQYVSTRDAHKLDDDVKMFFVLNNATLDSAIWAWGMKRKYDYVRPVTAVHYVYGNQTINAWAGPGMGTGAIAGSAWQPYQSATFVTPPFAEYVSGHSTFSNASAVVLEKFTNSDVFGLSVTIPAGSSRVEPGLVPSNPLVLSWATFSDAANEASLSRRYGGIHFMDGDLEARRVGKLIGEAAFNASLKLINGRNKDDADDKDNEHRN